MMLEIVIDRKKCTVCSLCIDACPVSCLVFDDAESVVLSNDLENCLVCRSCEDHCAPRCLQVVFPEWQCRSSIRSEHLVTELPEVSELYKQGHLSIAKDYGNQEFSSSKPASLAQSSCVVGNPVGTN